ncbi:MAG: inner membrane CreD family protein [Candidatus Eremiobacteraeota bacterium]|nr:inner membrane CreD family protein [Candidatus Eremiobacteraeota bacterium]
MKRLVGLTFIFGAAALAWLILEATLVQRTATTGEEQLEKITAQWGSSQTQTAPQVTAKVRRGKTAETVSLPVIASRIAVGLNLEQRRVGLLWYNLYDVRFIARYEIHNGSASSDVAVQFPLPATDATYTDFIASIGGRRVEATARDRGIGFVLSPGERTELDVAYQSRGMGTWTYRFGDGVQSVRDFSLAMDTNFAAIDFPAHTLLPVRETRAGKGYRLDWRYQTLLTGDGIGMAFPYPLQPGPLAQRITLWAPVALFFYFFVMLVVTTLRGVDLHPINYFFLAASFFAFHLLFAYLVDRIPLEAAFVICSAVTLFLTISYLRLVVGWRFAAIESGIAQLIYLILFSFALFNEGWSGLTITIGAIITLFVTMQATGRIDWSKRLSAQA